MTQGPESPAPGDADDRGVELDLRSAAADRRDQRADDREQRDDVRSDAGDRRDRRADEREEQLDAWERRLTAWEDELSLRERRLDERPGGVVSSMDALAEISRHHIERSYEALDRAREAVDRSAALLDRQRERADREQAEVDRERDRPRHQADLGFGSSPCGVRTERDFIHEVRSKGVIAMNPDPLHLYGQASEWTLGKVAGARKKLDAKTPCDDWSVRELLNHMLETQRFFVGSARGRDVAPPSAEPPELLGNDPLADFERARAETLATFAEPGVIEKTGPSLGIAFSDQLLHGWDLARATGQDTKMPDGLAEAAYEMIHGRFTEEQRKGVFKPEVPVREGVSAQERLLAYTGRDPSR